MRFPAPRTVCPSEHRTMDKVQKPSNPKCHTPSSEPFRIYLNLGSLKTFSILIAQSSAHFDNSFFAQKVHCNNDQLHAAEPFLRNRKLRSHSTNSKNFMELEGSFTCSQQPILSQINPVHIIFIHSFINQWIYSPSMGPGPFFSFVIIFTQSAELFGRVISPSQGRYLHTGQHKQNKRTQTSMLRMGFESTNPAFEGAKAVHASHRAATVIGFSPYHPILFL
jgi:hypothetical protein